MSKFASIDFEYYDTAEKNLNVVCCSIRHDGETHNYWTHKNAFDTHTLLVPHIKLLKERGYTFLAYAVTAEASAFLSLGLNPLDYKWVDLYLEFRCLSNHNSNYKYGKHLVNGRVKHLRMPKPKWERKTEKDHAAADASKQEYGMGAAAYKTLGVIIDSDFKKEIRDLIIACNSGKTDDIEAMVARKDDIMGYCASDVEYLEPMFMEMLNEYKRLLGSRFSPNQLREDIFRRSAYACRTAKMERFGYPIHVDRTRNFSSQVPNILWSCQHDINSQFDFEGDDRLFRNKVKKRPFELSWNQIKTRKELRKWINETNYKGWILTDGGQSGIKDLSLSLKAFQKPIQYRHNYPTGNLLAQFQRYLKLKQDLNGFTANDKGKKKKFWDSVGEDGRVRPYFGIYGAQSSRSQPSATAFIHLKSAWLRSLVQPPKGRLCGSIDWASEEFLVSALLSKDPEMIKAYQSGDVYLSFAKDAKVVPKEATKSTHKKERNLMKPIILGQQYDLTKYGLATQLTEATGKKTSEDEAESWIQLHKRIYKVLWGFKARVQLEYSRKKFIRLPDGWYIWGDNPNKRSVGNFPTQGFSASIMRKAVELAQDAGLDVIFTLHDALYIEFDEDDIDAMQTLAECMDEAFRYYFPEEQKPLASCRMDADVWGDSIGNSYEEDIEYHTSEGWMKMPVKYQNIYIDERGVTQYEKFKQYFKDVPYDNYEF